MKAILLRLLGNVGRFLLSLLRRGVYDTLDQILPIALEVVLQVARDPSLVTDEEKRRAAFESLKRRLAIVGISVSASLINLAIEMAIQRLKEIEDGEKGS